MAKEKIKKLELELLKEKNKEKAKKIENEIIHLNNILMYYKKKKKRC